jgi:hypothetical protein
VQMHQTRNQPRNHPPVSSPGGDVRRTAELTRRARCRCRAGALASLLLICSARLRSSPCCGPVRINALTVAVTALMAAAYPSTTASFE